ncbi:hypothetical protein Z043_116264 [Scleropages formosus]|uniref:Uncharacterized protein n=1 Tax=Scleropages formosus TaxID=113540 RepID=A0A0P7TVH3_SCLFO|nr:hypothetical protein Z043_116264 [Scleropages formosus]
MCWFALFGSVWVFHSLPPLPPHGHGFKGAKARPAWSGDRPSKPAT